MPSNWSTTARLLRSWIPVAVAVLVAVAAAWAIVGLHRSADHAQRTHAAVAAMQEDLGRPEGLLLDAASTPLRRNAAGVPLPVPGAARHSAAFQTQNFHELAAMRASTGAPHLVDAVTRNLHAMTSAQEAINAGGPAAALAAQDGRGIISRLKGSLAALLLHAKASAGTTNTRSDGGTWLIALLGALGVVVLLRRSDRARRRDTQRHTAELQRQALHDPLTGLANRRKLDQDLPVISRDATERRPAQMAMFDLDGFKRSATGARGSRSRVPTGWSCCRRTPATLAASPARRSRWPAGSCSSATRSTR